MPRPPSPPTAPLCFVCQARQDITSAAEELAAVRLTKKEADEALLGKDKENNKVSQTTGRWEKMRKRKREMPRRRVTAIVQSCSLFSAFT